MLGPTTSADIKFSTLVMLDRISKIHKKKSSLRQSQNLALQKKRAGTSHKPHPKATCPHPTRPLRPPGRRAPDDYAQVGQKMQPKVDTFSHRSSQFENRARRLAFERILASHLCEVVPTQCYEVRRRLD